MDKLIFLVLVMVICGCASHSKDERFSREHLLSKKSKVVEAPVRAPISVQAQEIVQEIEEVDPKTEGWWFW